MLLHRRSIKRLLKILSFIIVVVFVYLIWNKETLPDDEIIDRTLFSLRTKLNENRQEKKNIFCIILTKVSNFNLRTKIVNKTWAFDCDKYYFIAKLDENNPQTEVSYPYPIIQPSNYPQEDYNKLTDKVFGAFKEIYLRYNDYNWYLKADDDTIIFMDHLRDFLKDKNIHENLTYGCNFKKLVYRGYQSGGAGYVLSREVFTRLGKKLVENNSFCDNNGVEDQDVARCLRKLDVYMGKSVDDELRERFHPFDVKFHFHGHYLSTYYSFTEYPVRRGIESSSETSISFHYLTPYKIYKLYIMWLEYKINVASDKKLLFTSMLQNFLNS
jgi:glycoprotein-N-acetylgalactosamine 3-beta-galactosyltransferase